METFDVIIVGSGPAGSTAAKTVAERGLKVLVLEKDTLDREKPCAGGVTHGAVEYFKIPEKAFARKCTGLFLCSPKNKTAVMENLAKNSWLAMRGVFDRVLCEIAMDKGAEFSEKSLVEEPLVKDGKVVGVKAKIKGKTKIIEGKLIIGADGTPSTMATKLELNSNKPNTIASCFQYQMELPNELIEQRIGGNIELYFGSEWVPVGYTWIFPKDNIVSVGNATWMDVIKAGKINLKKQLDYFIKKHPIGSKKLEGAKGLYSQAHLIGFPGVLKENAANGCLIAGDASGAVSIATGEGIRFSMKSGEAAGLTAVETLRKDDVSASTLRTTYDNFLDQTVKDDLRLAFRVRKMFLNTDSQQERTVVSAARDPWFADLVENLVDGTYSYKKVFRRLWRRPDKVIKALLFYR